MSSTKPSIRPYTVMDSDLLAGWLKARGMAPFKASSLPPIGFVCDERAIGFLYTTNSSIAIIEGVVTDPHTVPSLRRESLKRLCCHLVDVSLELGHCNIIAATSHPSIEAICKSLGFEEQSVKLFALREKM